MLKRDFQQVLVIFHMLVLEFGDIKKPTFILKFNQADSVEIAKLTAHYSKMLFFFFWFFF